MDIHARLWGEPQPPDHQERGGTALKEKIYAAFAKNAKSMEGLRNNTVQYVPGVLKISKALILSPEDYDKLAEDISPEYPFLKDKPLLDEIAALAKERRRLYRSEPESPRIGQLTARLQALRKENRLCGTIEQHSVEIDQRLAEAKAKRQRYMENENKKGVDRTERRQDTRQRDG